MLRIRVGGARDERDDGTRLLRTDATHAATAEDGTTASDYGRAVFLCESRQREVVRCPIDVITKVSEILSVGRVEVSERFAPRTVEWAAQRFVEGVESEASVASLAFTFRLTRTTASAPVQVVDDQECIDRQHEVVAVDIERVARVAPDLAEIRLHVGMVRAAAPFSMIDATPSESPAETATIRGVSVASGAKSSLAPYELACNSAAVGGAQLESYERKSASRFLFATFSMLHGSPVRARIADKDRAKAAGGLLRKVQFFFGEFPG